MEKNEDADGDVSGGVEVSHVLVVVVEQVKLGAVVALDVAMRMKNSPIPLGLLHPHQVVR